MGVGIDCKVREKDGIVHFPSLINCLMVTIIAGYNVIATRFIPRKSQIRDKIL